METLQKALADIQENMPSLDLRENEPMKEHCSFKIGGPVTAFAAPKDIWELTRLFYYLHMNNVAPLVIGKGTNIIIPDEGLDICVVSTENLTKLRLGETENTIYAEAGVSLARLAQFAQQNGLAGLEFASGIPGSVGGGVLMNAGAYGGEMKDVVFRTEYLDADGRLQTVNGDAHDFAYRHSVFSDRDCLVLRTSMKLAPGRHEDIAARMRELGAKRRASQPLDMPSAGSTFKRPVGGYAAALIDEAGLKGFRIGGAQVSEKHAGFVVNAGGASFDDVLRLMEHIQKTVYERSGIELVPEVKIIH